MNRARRESEDLKAITLQEWQDYMDCFRADGKHAHVDFPLAVRCENSQLSLGWKMGGFTLNGHTYVSFATENAMLAVSGELMRWVAAQRRGAKRTRSDAAKAAQGDLGL